MTAAAPVQRNYGQDWTPKYIHYVAIVLMMSMLVNQFLNLKFIDVFGVSLVASYLTYPLSLIVCDVLSEVYGFRRTRRLIYACIALYVLNMGLVQLVLFWQPGEGYTNDEAFRTLFGSLPQIVGAGVLGYLSGELINSYVMSRIKVKTDGRHFFFRALFSTGISQIVNCVIFFGIGFWGVMPPDVMLQNIAAGVFIILGYEALVLPFTARICAFLKRREGIDHFDGPRQNT